MGVRSKVFNFSPDIDFNQLSYDLLENRERIDFIKRVKDSIKIWS